MSFINFVINLIFSIINSIWNWIISEPGTIVSILALCVAALTLFANTQNNKKNNFDNLFFHLISLLNKIISSKENSSEEINGTLNSIKTKAADSLKQFQLRKIKKYYENNIDSIEKGFVTLENLYLDIERNKLESIRNDTSISTTKEFPIRKNRYLKEAEKLADITMFKRPAVYYTYFRGGTVDESNLYEFDVNDNAIENLLISMKFNDDPSLATYKIFNTSANEKFMALIKELKLKFPKKEGEIDQINTKLSNLFLPENTKIPHEIPETTKRDIVNTILLGNKHGIYFRTIHRILKIILDFSDSETVLNKYCGILRTQLSENHLMILFYNAEYADRGKKFKDLVKTMNLWGDSEELDTDNNSDVIHFTTSNLIWKDKDLEILRNQYVRK